MKERRFHVACVGYLHFPERYRLLATSPANTFESAGVHPGLAMAWLMAAVFEQIELFQKWWGVPPDPELKRHVHIKGRPSPAISASATTFALRLRLALSDSVSHPGLVVFLVTAAKNNHFCYFSCACRADDLTALFHQHAANEGLEDMCAHIAEP